MDAKALKSSLKTAVENIKLKKYVETVKICKVKYIVISCEVGL